MPHISAAKLKQVTHGWFSATVLGCIMVVMVWAGLIAKYLENQASDLADFTRDAKNLALLSEENVLRSIGEMDKALLYLRRTIETSPEPRNYHSIVNTTDVLSEIIVQFAIIDANGTMRASNVGPQPAPATDLSDRAHYRHHVGNAKDELFISKPLIGRASGRWSVQLTRRFSGRDGSFAGVVVASFNPDHFSKFFGKIEIGPNAAYALVGVDGTVRAAGGNLAQGGFKLGQDLSRHPVMQLVKSRRNGTITDIDGSTSQQRRFAVRAVAGQPLAVLVSADEAAIFAASRLDLHLYCFAGLLLTAMIGIATWLARQSEQEVKLKARQLELTLEHMSQGIMLVTHDLQIPIMNRRCAELLDLPETMLQDPPTFDALTRYQEARGEFVSSEVPHNLSAFEVFGPQDAIGRFEMYERTRPNGTVLEVRSTRLDDGSFVRTISDVTRRMEAQSEADRLASEDTLTGLANRRVLTEALERLSQSAGDGKPYAILYLDLDRFKIVNDTQGHAVGDLLLKAVAERMRQALRSTDLVARIGGDEFGVLMHATDEEGIPEMVAQRLVDRLSRPYDIDGHHLLIGTSVGIAVGPADGATANELLIAADLALYTAKSAGRGTYRFFRKEMNEEVRARQQIEVDLREALVSDQLELYYQPIVDLASRVIIGFEALARWNHPTKGLVMPDKFIPVAEDCGLITVLGEWALREACRQAAQWPCGFKIAVNLSPAQFASPSLLPTVRAALAASGLPARRLELEITESLLMLNTERTLEVLHQLKGLGVRIAMDDFGTGYSSLSYLQSFPFDKIKIDRSFVRSLADTPKSLSIVRSIVDIAGSLGMTTTAEGVETEAQRQSLLEIGCGEAQGYLFGRPEPAEIAASLVIDQMPQRAVA